jgi:Vitamin K-dependent gamma-carboxylase
MRPALSAWDRFWFVPVATSTFALFRMAFALVTLGWTLSLAPTLFAFYSTDGILPAQPDYAGDAAWGLLGIFTGNAAVTVLYFLLFVGSIFLLFGFQTRISALVVFVCLVSFGRRNPWVLNSGDLLLQTLAFYVLLMPSGAALSVDRWLKRGENFWEFPARAIWPLRLVQIQVSIIYLAAVWAKVRGFTWNDGTAVSYALRVGDIARLPVPGFITDSLVITNVLTYGTLATELAIGILVWNRMLRPWVLLAGVGLHLGIDYSVRVGFFSFAILITYIAFLPPGTATSLILSLRDRVAGWSLGPPLRRATRKL